MKRKLPHDAFAVYAAQGPNRSYAAVAKHFRCDKKTVTRLAQQENWQAKIAEIERNAQVSVREKVETALEEMTERHLKIVRVVQAKALDALRGMSLRTALDAVKALDFSVRHERLIVGEPTDRQAVSVEDVIRREYDRWLIKHASPADATDASTGPDAPQLPLEHVDVKEDHNGASA